METLKIITYVLDDDYEELLLLQEPLQKVCGCDLQLFTEVDEFINAIDRGVHICIIDHRLSAGVDGIEVGEMVLKKNKFARMILFTGSGSEDIWKKALNVGFKGGVDKNSIDCYQEVADMVANWLPAIRLSVQEWDMLNAFNSKYEKYRQ